MKPIPRLLSCTAGLLFVAAACDSGTSGRLGEVSLTASSLAEGSAPLGVFTTDTGWSVVLTEAKLVLAGVYAFAPDPAEQAALASLFAPGLLAPGLARAHGGVDPLANRKVRAQWLDPLVFDALSAAPVELGPELAELGATDALELRLAPPPAELAPETQGHVAYVAGTATRGATTIDFQGGIDVPDVGTTRRIESIAFEATLAAGGVVSLGLRPATWFRGVELERLPAPDPSTGVTALVAGSQPYEALRLGIRNPLAYEASYEASAGGAP